MYEHRGSIVRCRTCRLPRRHPVPSSAELEGIYRADEYFRVAGSRAIGYGDYFADEAVYRPYFRDRLRLLSRFREPPGQLFEVGAAAGFALDEARQLGWSVGGFELSHAAAEFARREYQLKVQELPIEALAADGQFDAVVAFQTIEHFVHVADGLSAIRQALKPGGVALLTTPDHGSLPRMLMRRYWISYRPEHLVYFDRRTLRAMLEKSGFTVELIRPDRGLLVPFRRIVERAAHFYAPQLRPDLLALPAWRIPVWLGDMVSIARRR